MLNIPTQIQVREAVAAFLDQVRRGHLSYEELLDPKWIEQPIFWALRAAETERPVALQDCIQVDHDTHGLGFRVEVWTRDEKQIEEVVAASNLYLVAFAAFGAAVKARNTQIVLLRRGGNVLEEHRPPPALRPKRVTSA